MPFRLPKTEKAGSPIPHWQCDPEAAIFHFPEDHDEPDIESKRRLQGVIGSVDHRRICFEILSSIN